MAGIGEQLHLSLEETTKILDTINKINPGAALSLVIKEIALYLDSKYPDHIRNCKIVYVLSFLDGRIHKVETKDVVPGAYKTVSMFRSLEEARFACKIVGPILKSLGNGK